MCAYTHRHEPTNHILFTVLVMSDVTSHHQSHLGVLPCDASRFEVWSQSQRWRLAERIRSVRVTHLLHSSTQATRNHFTSVDVLSRQSRCIASVYIYGCGDERRRYGIWPNNYSYNTQESVRLCVLPTRELCSAQAPREEKAASLKTKQQQQIRTERQTESFNLISAVKVLLLVYDLIQQFAFCSIRTQ